jgi:hypothetical protein
MTPQTTHPPGPETGTGFDETSAQTEGAFLLDQDSTSDPQIPHDGETAQAGDGSGPIGHGEHSAATAASQNAAGNQPPKTENTPPTPERLAELAQAANQYVAQVAERFESQYGYKPSDETLFGWQMQAESILQNQELQRRQTLTALEAQAGSVEARFEQSGFPKSAGRHYVNIVKETGAHIIENPQLNRLAVAQAIGLAAMESRGASSIGASSNGEPISGDAIGVSFNTRESDDARKHLRKILKREPSAAEIKEWIEL